MTLRKRTRHQIEFVVLWCIAVGVVLYSIVRSYENNVELERRAKWMQRVEDFMTNDRWRAGDQKEFLEMNPDLKYKDEWVK